MNPADFANNYKYKFLIPGLYVASVIFMVFGYINIRDFYRDIGLYVICYLPVKSTIQMIIGIISYFKANKILDRAQEMILAQTNSNVKSNAIFKQVFYAFIIPSYKEDQEMLSETLSQIASHKQSKINYLVFLAMEGHQENSDLKAQRLIKKHKTQFFLLGYTRHQLRPFQHRGKASNVSWCAQRLQDQFFIPNKVPADKVLLTIIDADSWVPEIYIKQVQSHLSQPQHLAKRQRYIYQPNQIFTRNHLEVNVINRVYDQVHGGMHNNNLLSLFNITFPLSNYSLHFSLAKNVGWWDTCADAIGQDFHMTEKTLWKTNGQIETVPIFAPFNQVNLQTGKGIIADIKARFWQGERHARGVGDIPYNINMLINRPFNWRTFLMAIQIAQSFTIAAILPWFIITYSIQGLHRNIFYPTTPKLIYEDQVSIIFTLHNALGTIAYLFYWMIKKRATKILYGFEQQSDLRALQYILINGPLQLIASLFCYPMAAFGTLLGNTEYVVAEKVLKKKQV